MIECHVGPSSLGHILYRAENDALTELFFVGQKHFPAGMGEPGLSRTAPASRVIAAASEQVDEYFAGARSEFSVALRLNGTEFQRRVWHLLRQIPFGDAWTYGDLARRLGLAARRVARGGRRERAQSRGDHRAVSSCDRR